MKIQLSFKTPDALHDAVKEEVNGMGYLFLIDHDVEEVADLSPELREELAEKTEVLREELNSALEHWIKYGECITVELDTTTREGIVIPCK
jgi:hypothetical protein